MSNIQITIKGCCSSSKSELAKIIGQKLKEMTFGKVYITGTDYKGDSYKGLLRDETVEIEVIPEELEIRSGFKGNLKFVKEQRFRNKIELNLEL